MKAYIVWPTGQGEINCGEAKRKKILLSNKISENLRKVRIIKIYIERDKRNCLSENVIKLRIGRHHITHFKILQHMISEDHYNIENIEFYFMENAFRNLYLSVQVG